MHFSIDQYHFCTTNRHVHQDQYVENGFYFDSPCTHNTCRSIHANIDRIPDFWNTHLELAWVPGSELLPKWILVYNMQQQYDNATVRQRDSTPQYDNATVRQRDSTTTRQYDNATTRQYDNATVRHRDSSTARQYDSATVRQRDSTTIRQYDGPNKPPYNYVYTTRTMHEVMHGNMVFSTQQSGGFLVCSVVSAHSSRTAFV